MKNNTIAEVQITYAPKVKSKLRITDSESVYRIFKDIWNEHIAYKESMYVLLLNRANFVLGYHLLSMGGTTATVVDIKLLLQLLVKSNAHSFVLAHNHPSFNTKPSEEDLRLTCRIKEATKLMEVVLLDHIILTADDDYFSFADEGVL